jgi:hypothetical protein
VTKVSTSMQSSTEIRNNVDVKISTKGNAKTSLYSELFKMGFTYFGDEFYLLLFYIKEIIAVHSENHN